VTIRNSMLAMTTVFGLAIAGVACERSSQDAREDAAELQQKADQERDEARQKAREESQDAQRTANEVGSRTGAATETFDIKTALMMDKTVDASDINVDTYADSRTVVLRGTVPSMDQKEQAGAIATREAEGYRVDNQLKVKAKP
jgi:osmotically-inducible protein OsmY